MVSLNTDFGVQAKNNLASANKQVSSSISRLSSGNKINHASDDVAGLSVGTVLRTGVTALKSALVNASQAQSMLSVADGALAQVGEMLNRQKALASQANSGSLNDTTRSFLNLEFQTITSEIDRLSNSTHFNNIKLVDGSLALDMVHPETSGVNFQVGSQASDVIKVNISSSKTTDLYKDNLNVAHTLSIGTQADASTASDIIDNAINSVVSMRANVGSLQSRMDYVSANVSSSIENQDSARSMFLDTDVAQESTNLAQGQVKLQASVSVLAQANQLSQGLLKLIG